ncbi:MAG TPA: CHASE domain-containing protein, partial [Acidimicrobiales bacterium]|nr:CHASE domain-containing protein [Acidimicrobiales bacterium]
MVALLGIAVVGSGAWYWHTRNVSQAQTQFGTASEDLSGDITRALGQNGDLLAGSAALFDQGVVTRAQYHVFLKSQGFEVGRFPGMLGVGLIQEVSAGQLPAFLASLNADGVAVSSIAPSGERPEYCLGSYADWTNLKSSVPLFGYDFCTVPALAEVLTRATATAQQQVLSGSVL